MSACSHPCRTLRPLLALDGQLKSVELKMHHLITLLSIRTVQKMQSVQQSLLIVALALSAFFIAPQVEAQQAVTRGGGEPADQLAAAPLRLATWNIRWFPRGCPDAAECPELRTDLHALAARIADLEIDLLAVQEILYDADGKSAMATLLSKLDSLTTGRWQVDLQECGALESQRVGFVWDDSRVHLSSFADVAQLNGGIEEGGGACAANLRPGRYAYARARDGSLDFHAVTVHFDSGRRDKDFNNRRDATAEIPRLMLDDTLISELDEDVVVFGDFNTMGQGDPSEITADEEFQIFDTQIGAAFKRLEVEPFCSEYYRGRGGVLDFFVVSKSLLSSGPTARVRGYCAEAACSVLNEDDMPRDYRRISDHCPVVLDLYPSGS